MIIKFIAKLCHNLNVSVMDKLSIISGALFLAADMFAIASLCMPNWIVSSVSGEC